MPEVILPCPECHSLSVGLCSGTDEITHELYNQAFCTSCGVSGPKVFADEISAISAWNALPRALPWTNEPPKVAGIYLIRSIFDGEQQGDVGVITVKTPFDYDKSHFMQFAGPIPLPLEG